MTCYSTPVRVMVCPDTPSQETKPALPCSGFIPATGRLLLQRCIPSTGTVAQQAAGTEVRLGAASAVPRGGFAWVPLQPQLSAYSFLLQAAEFRVFPPPSAPVSV